MNNQPIKIVKKVIYGQEVDVKVYATGASNYVDEEDLELTQEEPTVKPTGVEFYLKKDD